MWSFLDSYCSYVSVSTCAHEYFILISDITVGIKMVLADCPFFLFSKGETKCMIYF